MVFDIGLVFICRREESWGENGMNRVSVLKVKREILLSTCSRIKKRRKIKDSHSRWNFETE
jgi:hypothetical protein